MKSKYWFAFLSILSLNVLFIFLKITGVELVIFTMIIPCLILFWFKYEKLSKEIERLDRHLFENESVYLKALDLHYLNPFSALSKSNKDNQIIEKIRNEYKLIFAFKILSFLTLIILDLLVYLTY